jgi:hypothetical protein
MSDQVMGLAHQLGFGIAGYTAEYVVGVSDDSAKISLGNDQLIVTKRDFAAGRENAWVRHAEGMTECHRLICRTV